MVGASATPKTDAFISLNVRWQKLIFDMYNDGKSCTFGSQRIFLDYKSWCRVVEGLEKMGLVKIEKEVRENGFEKVAKLTLVGQLFHEEFLRGWQNVKA